MLPFPLRTSDIWPNSLYDMDCTISFDDAPLLTVTAVTPMGQCSYETVTYFLVTGSAGYCIEVFLPARSYAKIVSYPGSFCGTTPLFFTWRRACPSRRLCFEWMYSCISLSARSGRAAAGSASLRCRRHRPAAALRIPHAGCVVFATTSDL